MLPTPTTLAETEKQQKPFHTAAADPRNAYRCAGTMIHCSTRRYNLLPHNNYFTMMRHFSCRIISKPPLSAFAGRAGGARTWFSSCTSMLYWGPGCTSVTFSPRRKPRRVMSVFAASSTDGGGPSSCSASPKREEKQIQTRTVYLGHRSVFLPTKHRYLVMLQRQYPGFQVIHVIQVCF